MSETTINVLIPALASIAVAWLGMRLAIRRKNGNGSMVLPGQLALALYNSEREVGKLRRGVRKLINQIIGAGLAPVWMPDGDTGPLENAGET